MAGDLFSVAPTPAARAPQPRRTVAFTHPCEAPGCKAWGCFGFGLPIGRGPYFCHAHRALGDLPPTPGATP